MTQGIYLKLCGSEYKIASTGGPAKKKDWCDRNLDIVNLIICAVAGVFAILYAYNYMPCSVPSHGMMLAGGLIVLATFTFTQGIMLALIKHGCISKKPILSES